MAKMLVNVQDLNRYKELQSIVNEAHSSVEKLVKYLNSAYSKHHDSRQLLGYSLAQITDVATILSKGLDLNEAVK